MRFVQSAPWCGWNNTATCNGIGTGGGHPHFTQGQLYSSADATLAGFIDFNGYAYVGNCGTGGGDGIAFSSQAAWPQAGLSYGGAWPATTNGGAVFHWGSGLPMSDTLTYWIR